MRRRAREERLATETILFVSGMMWAATTLQALTGFGFMMLSVPFLVLALPAQVVVPGLILMWLPLGTVQMMEHWRWVNRRALTYMVLGGVVTLPVGAVILRQVDPETMQRAIGGVMIGLAVLLQINPGAPFQRERAATIGAGMLSGILATSTSVSGPPVVLLGLKQRWTAKTFRATLVGYFLLISFCCLPFFWGMDLLNKASLELALWGIPGVAVGYITGVRGRRRVRGRRFRWVAVGMVMGGGLVAVVL